MLRTRASGAAATVPDMQEKSAELEEKVNLEGDNDPEETIEEEVEYKQAKEEVEGEVEEEEEVEEVQVEEEEEEEEEEEGEEGDKAADGDTTMKEGDDSKKHAELLARPRHGLVFVLAGIPHDATEEDLKRFCKSIGEEVEVRVRIRKDIGGDKGYAYVMFKTKEMATKALEKLNNTELKGKKVRFLSSQAKHKLFIGNVPRTWGEQYLRKVISDVGPGVDAIELLKDPQNSSRNRGFAFIEYYNHVCANYSKEKMSHPDFRLGNNSIAVSWADPKNAESSMPSQEAIVFEAIFKPGVKVKGKVIAVQNVGAIVRLRSGIKAVCPAQHMSECLFENPNEIFKVGAVLKFRVLCCKAERITLTHKEKLVESKLKILSTYADAIEGLVTHGWISHMVEDGYFVRFYHSVYGLALRSELGEEPGWYHIGQVVKCRVARSDPASRRIYLILLP